jgi:hypothetical protein
VWPPLAALHAPAMPRRELSLRESRRQYVRADRRRGNLVAEVAFYVGQGDCELLAGEADRIPLRSGSRRASDAVHVIGGILRQVEVEDMADIGDVQSA